YKPTPKPLSNQILAEIQAPMLGRCMPGSKFFEPNPNFVKVMKALKKTIYDVGCGKGHVTKALRYAGCKVIALDLMHHDQEEVEVLIADALIFPFKLGSVIMFCRPCHGHFVERTIDNAIECGVAGIVYAGLSSNRKDDLGKYSRHFKAILRNVGKDGE